LGKDVWIANGTPFSAGSTARVGVGKTVEAERAGEGLAAATGSYEESTRTVVHNGAEGGEGAICRQDAGAAADGKHVANGASGAFGGCGIGAGDAGESALQALTAGTQEVAREAGEADRTVGDRTS
jgi:hypothetical protein